MIGKTESCVLYIGIVKERQGFLVPGCLNLSPLIICLYCLLYNLIHINVKKHLCIPMFRQIDLSLNWSLKLGKTSIQRSRQVLHLKIRQFFIKCPNHKSSPVSIHQISFNQVLSTFVSFGEHLLRPNIFAGQWNCLMHLRLYLCTVLSLREPRSCRTN